jgi:hypothetical protein
MHASLYYFISIDYESSTTNIANCELANTGYKYFLPWDDVMAGHGCSSTRRGQFI